LTANTIAAPWVDAVGLTRQASQNIIGEIGRFHARTSLYASPRDS
jgi:hypothetical protein